MGTVTCHVSECHWLPKMGVLCLLLVIMNLYSTGVSRPAVGIGDTGAPRRRGLVAVLEPEQLGPNLGTGFQVSARVRMGTCWRS